MPNAPQPQSSGRTYGFAPGVHIVVSKRGQANVYEIVHPRVGMRQVLSERDYAVLTMVRGGRPLEEIQTASGNPDAARRLCERLVGAGLLVETKGAVGFLPDDHPQLATGVRFERSADNGVILCHPPYGGRPAPMRDIEAAIAKSFDGKHTVVDVVEAARMKGIPATLEKMISFLKELHGMGLLEQAVEAPGWATANTEGVQVEELPVVQGTEGGATPIGSQDEDGPTNWPSPHLEVSRVEAVGAVGLPDDPNDPGYKLEALRSLSLDKDAPASGGSRGKWLLIALALGLGGGGIALFRLRPGFSLGLRPSASAAPSTRPSPSLSPFSRPSAIPVASSAPLPIVEMVGNRRIHTIESEISAEAPVMAAGYVAAKEPITLGVTISGRVAKVMVQDGDLVKESQLLVQFDDSQTRAQMGLALAKKKDAERQLERTQTLFKSQAATQSDLDKAVGQAEVARAEVNLYAQQLEQAKVRSPINKGTVLEVMVHPGEVLTPVGSQNTGVLKMADLTRLVAEIDVNEGDVGKLRMGQRSEIVTDSAPDHRYQGTVSDIGQEADRARGTVLVKVDLSVPDRSLRPGNSVKATFPLGDSGRILINHAAIDRGTVWVLGGDGRVARKPVVTRPGKGDELEVLNGLAYGDRVVLDHAGLKPGQILR